jgi:excisionase family DNA binding protein
MSAAPNVPAGQVSAHALMLGDRSAHVDSSAPRPENATAGRRGDRRATAPPIERLAYTVNDTCAATGLGRSSIYELIAAGKLKSVRLAGRRLILSESLHELLQGAA